MKRKKNIKWSDRERINQYRRDFLKILGGASLCGLYFGAFSDTASLVDKVFNERVNLLTGEQSEDQKMSKVKEIFQKRTENLAKEYARKFYETIVKIESNWHVNVVSPMDAVGLMQLRQEAVTEYNRFHKTNFSLADAKHNPHLNMEMGIGNFAIIRGHYLPFYGLQDSLENVIATYNWGIGNLQKNGDATGRRDSLPRDTRDYLTKLEQLGVSKLPWSKFRYEDLYQDKEKEYLALKIRRGSKFV